MNMNMKEATAELAPTQVQVETGAAGVVRHEKDLPGADQDRRLFSVASKVKDEAPHVFRNGWVLQVPYGRTQYHLFLLRGGSSSARQFLVVSLKERRILPVEKVYEQGFVDAARGRITGATGVGQEERQWALGQFSPFAGNSAANRVFRVEEEARPPAVSRSKRFLLGAKDELGELVDRVGLTRLTKEVWKRVKRTVRKRL